ncbi:ATP-binding protein [Dokdonella sp.]|uniref:ATP-binding protein n=1 Tax=Dokdonella sp. TaxID=2291710 RepID=UPI001B103B25|nr:ATP-binding protein [Dokdonella sp.]MBO9664345.1 HAMP domain-containing histidine kinase [Dokdonella sp.]
MNDPSPSLLRNLVMLRWLAVGGQAVAIVLAVHLLGIPLRAAPLWGGVAALAAFNLWAGWRARRSAEVGAGEIVAQVAVDIAVLAWVIAWSGGAMNPFAPLFLLPIALLAVALPMPWVLLTAVLCGLGYAASALFGVPLPHVHGAFADPFNLHLAGMAVMFAVSALVVVFFLTRLAQALRERERELARLREQFARNEGILALATHAAAVAHELNTPLATLTLMLEDRLDQTPTGADRGELETMAALVDACRDRVRELAAPADRAGADERPLAAAIEALIERWRLLRPAIELEREGDLADAPAARLAPGVGHLLIALLNNAADASEAAGERRIALHLASDGVALHGSVRDYGDGISEQAAPGALFRSTKPDGLGVGLALSHATVERLGGELSLQAAPGRGTRVSFRLPLQMETVA